MICTEVAGMKRILVKIVLPVSLLAVWMITCYPICRKAEGFDFFLYWVPVSYTHLEMVCDIGKRIPRVYLKDGNIVGTKDYFDDVFKEFA